jgi:glycosyltransferase involved in cell wall biosynthesis
VDLSRFRPKDRLRCQVALGWDPDRRHVLFPASRDRPEKRYALAQTAVALLDGDAAVVELHHLDGVAHEEMPTWLNACEALLLTSTHEGSPNVVKEALACDVPIVSVDVGDVRDRIETIDGCFIAEPTPQDLAAKLESVLERRGRINGRDRISELSLERVAEKVRDIYETLVSRGVESRRSERPDVTP